MTLQQWMSSNGKRDEDVAELVGISRVQVSRIRRGLSHASSDTAKHLASLTGTNWTDFIKPPSETAA